MLLWLVWAALAAVALPSEGTADTGLGECTAENISIPEGSSGVIMTNISSDSKALFVCKKSFSSPVCQLPDMRVRDGKLKYYQKRYKEHFSLSNRDLVVENASKWLAGEYQVQFNQNCLLRFFLDVPALGSNATHYVNHHYGAISAAVFVSFLVLATFALWIWRTCSAFHRSPRSYPVLWQ